MILVDGIFSSIIFFFFQAEDGIRDLVRSRGLGDVYKRQVQLIELPLGFIVECEYEALRFLPDHWGAQGNAITLSLIHI